MSTINDQLAFHRLSNMTTAGAPIKPAKPSPDAQLRKVATDFEGMLFKEMLRSMRKANDVLKSDSPFNSRESEFMRDWQDDELAQSLAVGGGIGLADELVDQTHRFMGTKPAAQ